MKIVVAPDSFKHTLSAREVAKFICAEGKIFFPNSEFIEFPVSDGGEGFLDTISTTFGDRMTLKDCKTEDPLGREIVGKFGILNRDIGDVGIIEVARAAGITLLEENERNPLEASSFGVGLLINEALSMGVKEFWIGIGGTATIDGGMGLLSALGVVFKNREGQILRGNGQQLEEVVELEQGSRSKYLKELTIKVFCDIDNPIIGPEGAIEEYGPQKGANPGMIEKLQKGMENYVTILENTMGICLKGSLFGAGGGMAAGLHALIDAQLVPGIDGVLDLTNFNNIVSSANLVITGEGKTDKQTLHGKAPIGVLKLCQEVGVPVILLSGCIDLDEYKYYFNGFEALMSTVFIETSKYNEKCDLRLKIAARNVFSLIKQGMVLGGK